MAPGCITVGEITKLKTDLDVAKILIQDLRRFTIEEKVVDRLLLDQQQWLHAQWHIW